MTEKTRTVVVFESHQQTIIRRSRRTVTAQVVPLPTVRPARKEHTWLGAWWRLVSRKGAKVFAPLSRRLMTKANERKNEP